MKISFQLALMHRESKISVGSIVFCLNFSDVKWKPTPENWLGFLKAASGKYSEVWPKWILVRLIFCFFKILSAKKMLLLRSRITLRYYLDFVTVIDVTAPSLQTYVVPRAVTEQTVTQSCRQVKFSVSKWLKLTQFHLLTPFFDWKKQFCKGTTYKTYQKRAFRL